MFLYPLLLTTGKLTYIFSPIDGWSFTKTKRSLWGEGAAIKDFVGKKSVCALFPSLSH